MPTHKSLPAAWEHFKVMNGSSMACGCLERRCGRPMPMSEQCGYWLPSIASLLTRLPKPKFGNHLLHLIVELEVAVDP